jgi:putative ABC transport system permease protein
VRALFPNEDPLGKEIKIEGTPFRVVGVMETLGNFFGQSRDNSVFIPLPTFDKYWRDVEPPLVVFFIILRPHTRADVHPAMDQITDVLRRRRQVPAGAPPNFGVSSQDSLLDFYNQLTGATWLVLTAISFVALMIGGIGVMNIMLVSVTERTKEIGIRKALGARRADILKQFLVEAVTLSAIGGATGVIIAWLLGRLVSAMLIPTYLSASAVIVAVTVSGAVGVAAGIFPAWKAARLDPIEALRAD